MSLDVWITVDEPIEKKGSGIFVRENGSTVEITEEEWNERNPGHTPCRVESTTTRNEVFEANITHNLTDMAAEAGLYEALWKGTPSGTAGDLIDALEVGLATLKSDPERFKKLSPPNGWGDYEGLVRFVEKYLAACKEYPTGTIGISA